MAPDPTTRRSFFGLAGGAALFCTIGGAARSTCRRRAGAARPMPRPLASAGRDDWHGHKLSGRNVYTADDYRLMTPGFAGYATPNPTIPGPTPTAEVGDVLVVHFRNGDRKLDQAVTMHPHGAFIDNPAMGPDESVTARFVEDNPGRWMYHCHVFPHQDAGMTGRYVVDP